MQRVTGSNYVPGIYVRRERNTITRRDTRTSSPDILRGFKVEIGWQPDINILVHNFVEQREVCELQSGVYRKNVQLFLLQKELSGRIA